MRLLIAALLLVLPAAADAQSDPAVPRTAQTPGLPPIGLPLPPIGLPLPQLGLRPGPTDTLSAPAPASPRPPHRGGGEPHAVRPLPIAVYVLPGYGWGPAFSVPTPGALTPALAPQTVPETRSARVPSGTLRLDLSPRLAGQVFVDGVYVGALDELGHELRLAEGTRQLEVRDPGYEPFVLAVRIVDGRALTYRGVLQPLPVAAAPIAPAPAPGSLIEPAVPPETPQIARKPLYFIPGCYLGDVPPKDAGLPATCDQSHAVTFRP